VGRLRGIVTVLLDLDGTLSVGSQVVPGALEAVRRLRDQGLTVRFCTNSDPVSPAALADRLARFGFEASEGGWSPRSQCRTRVLAVAADPVRRLLAEHLAGPGQAATHVLVADPSYGRPTTTWTPPSGPCGPGRNWWPHRRVGALLEYATGDSARALGQAVARVLPPRPWICSSADPRARWSSATPFASQKLFQVAN
jgi:hypothetical protein